VLAADLGTALDPALVLDRMGTPADPWQADILRSTARELLLLCSRQSGKSTTVGGLAAWTAKYLPGSLTLCLSPSQRQSGELFRKVKLGLAALDVAGEDLPEDNALSVQLANRSRVVSLPGKEATIRGFSGATLILVDEASRVPDPLYYAIRPMLAVSGGRIALLSTPWGKRGFFHQEWTEGGSAWHRVKVTAEQCPRISRAWLADERAKRGDWWYRQEYGCEFVETEDQVFSYEDVMGALSADVAPLFPLEVA
jgi:hypothetical protein